MTFNLQRDIKQHASINILISLIKIFMLARNGSFINKLAKTH